MLNSQEAQRWLGEATGHVPLPLSPCTGASLLWLNARAAPSDPAFHQLGRDLHRWGEHLLAQCAWRLAEEGASERIGYADRYGGSGIGHNGGSGRCATLGGYHVKGIGRTPLVSPRTPRTHAAGGAYLEEAVRETVFAEIVAQRFPHDAVPTLAIIDIDEVEDWHTDWSPRLERRVLLVRPSVLRPAHFERAAGQIGLEPEAQQQDAQRVATMFELAHQTWGSEGIQSRFERLWHCWAEQLAHGHIHRLTHGNHTSSNIALNGALLDFGAATALPSWARCASTYQPQGFMQALDALQGAIASHAHHLGRFVQPAFGVEEQAQVWQQQAAAAYQRGLCRSFIHAVGASPNWPLPEGFAAGLWIQLHRVLRVFDAEPWLDMLEHTQKPRLPLDLHRFWEDDGPAHWRPLLALLRQSFGATRTQPAAQRFDPNAWPRLCFPELKRALFAALDGSERGEGPPSRQCVARAIEEYVDIGLRAIPALQYALGSAGGEGMQHAGNRRGNSTTQSLSQGVQSLATRS
jgi:hypothetical protein